MAKVPQDTINRIRENADILDVVSQFVNLKKRGRNFFGICPFHHEKTASFSVAPDKGIYHCFGCGAGGNAINFIMEYEKISFIEALKKLGDQLGIPLEFEGGTDNRDFFSELYKIHESAADLYSRTLFLDRGKEALAYLKKRGLTTASLKFFRVGFAPASSTFLLNHIKEKYAQEILQKCGLFGQSANGDYDRFRGRIMFPIFHSSGRIIAFGGRAFGTDDPAKYLNSPETPLYHKQDVFYGLNITREAIRAAEAAILVEGYTDLIQLYQAGFKNVVALSGTAFSDRHAGQIRKFTARVYLAYDGDLAGRKATIRAGYNLLKGRVEPLVVHVPSGLDPDEWVRKDGGKEFKKALKAAGPLIDFQLETENITDLSAPERSNLVQEIVKEALAIKDPIIQADLRKKISQKLGLDEKEIIQLFKKQALKGHFVENKTGQKKSPQLFSSMASRTELGLIKIMAGRNKEARDLILEKLDLELFKDDFLKRLARLLKQESDLNPANLVGKFETAEEREIVSKLLMENDELSDPLQMAREYLQTLKHQILKKEIKDARLKIREMETSGLDPGEFILKVAGLQKQLNSGK